MFVCIYVYMYSCVVLILSCLSRYLAAHIHIRSDLLFGPRCHIYTFCVSSILNRCKYDLIFPCPVTMNVEIWFMLIFIFSLSATIGKHSCNFSLCCLVPFPLPLLYTYLTKFTSHYTFWNFLVAFYVVRLRPCLLCECVR